MLRVVAAMKNLNSTRKFLFPLIPLLIALVGAECLVRFQVIPAFLLPAPSQVVAAVAAEPRIFFTAFLQTAESAFLGLVLSMILGLSFALLLSYSRTVREMFYPYAIFFQTVPIIAVAPILVIWLGYGMPTVIAAAFIVSIFPIIANSVLGLLSTEKEMVALFRMMNASPVQVLFQLRFPFAIPHILGGFKIAAGLAVIGAIVGEFISGSGLGGVVDAARNQQRVDQVFAAVTLAAFLGILFFALISILSKILLKQFQMEK
jgi:NitT/TauT family transport system permease protein